MSLGKAYPTKGDEWGGPAMRGRTAGKPRRSRMSEHQMELGEVVRKCHFCYQSFALQEDLVEHLKEAHGVEEEPASASG
jgi:hypothetical protein